MRGGGGVREIISNDRKFVVQKYWEKSCALIIGFLCFTQVIPIVASSCQAVGYLFWVALS
jgi:hypothetical protein